MKRKLITILGARPQFIKAAVVSRVINQNSDLSEMIIHTGQHYDYNMSDLFFEELDIPKPHANLGIGSCSHGEQTGEMLKKIEEILLVEKPDAILVYGDTNSTLAGALAASKLHIPIAHVEAGLRSYNRRMPEEINRVITDHLSSFLFSPTLAGQQNLLKEGLTKNVYVTGDVMFDAIRFYQPRAEQNPVILQKLNLKDKAFILTTIHRAENTDDLTRLTAILDSLNELAKSYRIIFPIHPRTRSILDKAGIMIKTDNLSFVDPVGYLDMCLLLSKCSLMITDSGGVQKEAFMNKKYCITVRPETEWTELVENGFNYLCEPSQIMELAQNLTKAEFKNSTFQPYGKGNAGELIVKILASSL